MKKFKSLLKVFVCLTLVISIASIAGVPQKGGLNQAPAKSAPRR